jgi:hypothetical protein
MTVFARTMRCASVAGRNEKCPGDLLCCQAANFTQRERYLSFRQRDGSRYPGCDAAGRAHRKRIWNECQPCRDGLQWQAIIAP